MDIIHEYECVHKSKEKHISKKFSIDYKDLLLLLKVLEDGVDVVKRLINLLPNLGSSQDNLNEISQYSRPDKTSPTLPLTNMRRTILGLTILYIRPGNNSGS